MRSDNKVGKAQGVRGKPAYDLKGVKSGDHCAMEDVLQQVLLCERTRMIVRTTPWTGILALCTWK